MIICAIFLFCANGIAGRAPPNIFIYLIASLIPPAHIVAPLWASRVVVCIAELRGGRGIVFSEALRSTRRWGLSNGLRPIPSPCLGCGPLGGASWGPFFGCLGASVWPLGPLGALLFCSAQFPGKILFQAAMQNYIKLIRVCTSPRPRPRSMHIWVWVWGVIESSPQSYGAGRGLR